MTTQPTPMHALTALTAPTATTATTTKPTPATSMCHNGHVNEYQPPPYHSMTMNTASGLEPGDGRVQQDRDKQWRTAGVQDVS